MTDVWQSLWGIRCAWLRYFDVFRKSLFYSLITTFTEPLLYLLSFGFGVGSLIGTIQVQGMEVSYRQFIFAGVVAQTMLFQGFFEAAYGGFVRMYYQKIFKAIATTPITLSEVLWAELLWDATKGTLAVAAVVLIGVLAGEFRPSSLFTIIPFGFFCSFMFAGMGLAAAAVATTIEQISYPQQLLVFPMFLFCGAFFPIEKMVLPLQIVAWALPLTSVLSVVRTLALGFPFQWWTIPILASWCAGLIFFSRRAMIRRLIK